MHAKPLRLPLHLVLLHLGDIVANIINQRHPELALAHAEDILEARPDPVGDHLTVRESVVGRRRPIRRSGRWTPGRASDRARRGRSRKESPGITNLGESYFINY